MTTNKRMTIPEIRAAGFKAMLERLGPAGMLRFLQQFQSGQGDYTKDRAARLNEVTVNQIAQSIEQRRADGGGFGPASQGELPRIA